MNKEKVSNLINEYRAYAKKKGIKLNSSEVLISGLLRKMIENEEKYGYRYCPCRPINGNPEDDKKKICPCSWHEKEISENGHCHCGLFFK